MPYLKKQQAAARIALVAKKRGSSKGLKGSSLSMYNSMTMSELEDFAKGPIKRKVAGR